MIVTYEPVEIQEIIGRGSRHQENCITLEESIDRIYLKSTKENRKNTIVHGKFLGIVGQDLSDSFLGFHSGCAGLFGSVVLWVTFAIYLFLICAKNKNPNDSKSSQLNVVIFRFYFIHLRYFSCIDSSAMISNSLEVSNFNWLFLKLNRFIRN